LARRLSYLVAPSPFLPSIISSLFPYTTLFRSYLDFTDYLIIGASPEALVQVANNEVTTNPIAGTRPRGNNIAEDNALLVLYLQRSEEHTSELQSRFELVCRLLLEKKKVNWRQT